MAPTRTKGPRGLLSRLEAPTGIKSGAFIPVVVLHRDRNLLLVFFLSSACGSVYISLISISPPILPSLSYLLPSPTLPPLAQPERLTEWRAAGGEAPGGGFGHGGGSTRVANERRSRPAASGARGKMRQRSEIRLASRASGACGQRRATLEASGCWSWTKRRGRPDRKQRASSARSKLPSADGGEDLLRGTRRRRGPAARGAASRVALARRAASAVSGERPRTWPSR